MLKKNELPECPVAKFFQIVGNKWKIYILQKLFEKPCRFNELKNLIPGISAKVLSESLKQLEADGIICKKILAVIKMSEAFEILSAALNEAIEDAKSKNPKLERREVEIEVAEKKFDAKKYFSTQNL